MQQRESAAVRANSILCNLDGGGRSKNIRTHLEGRGHHRMTLEKTVPGRVSPIASDKKVNSAVQHKVSIHSFDGFLKRWKVGFSSLDFLNLIGQSIEQP
jgi:hypothetical protein